MLNMSSITNTHSTDTRFASKVLRAKSLSGIGYVILSLLSSLCSDFGAVVYSEQTRQSGRACAMHCGMNCYQTSRWILLTRWSQIALLVPPLIVSTGLVFTIKPNRSGLRKFKIAGVVAVLYFLVS